MISQSVDHNFKMNHNVSEGDMVKLDWRYNHDHGYGFAKVISKGIQTMTAVIYSSKISVDPIRVEKTVIPDVETPHQITLLKSGSIRFSEETIDGLNIQKTWQPHWSVWNQEPITYHHIDDISIKLIEMIDDGSITPKKLALATHIDWFSIEGETLLITLLATAIGFPEVIKWLESEPIYLNHRTATIFYETVIMNPDSIHYCDNYRLFYVNRFIDNGFPLH